MEIFQLRILKTEGELKEKARWAQRKSTVGSNRSCTLFNNFKILLLHSFVDTGCWTFHSIGTNFPSSQQKPAHAKCSQLSYVVKIPLLRPLLLHHWPAPSLSIFATSSYTDAAFEKYLLNIEEWKRLYFKTRGQPTTDKRDKTFLLAG